MALEENHRNNSCQTMPNSWLHWFNAPNCIQSLQKGMHTSNICESNICAIDYASEYTKYLASKSIHFKKKLHWIYITRKIISLSRAVMICRYLSHPSKAVTIYFKALRFCSFLVFTIFDSRNLNKERCQIQKS